MSEDEVRGSSLTDAQEQGQASAAGDAEEIGRLIREMGAQKEQLLAIIDACREPRTAREIDEMLEELRRSRRSVYSGIMMRSMLVRAGALECNPNDDLPELIYGDNGDLVLPEPSVPTWVATAGGLAALDAQDPYADLVAAIADDEHVQVYEVILSLCADATKAIAEIEDAVEGTGLLDEAGEQTGFFVGRLEDLGAIGWQDGWKTTETGRRYLARAVD